MSNVRKTNIRDWSLMMGRGGGYTTGGGGACEVFAPTKRGGGDNKF